MAKDATPKAEAKERRKARTIEERIAELQAKKEQADAKAREKASAALGEAEERVVKAEAKLGEALAKRNALRQSLGLNDDGFDEG